MEQTADPLRLPDRFARLKDIAYNLWWSWHPEARALFSDIDRALWRASHHNPVLLLRQAGERLKALESDPAFMGRYDAVVASFDRYLSSPATWFGKTRPDMAGRRVAYFSAEFGVHSSMRIYSGGLGILAGDHCKAASDLGVPLVGVGFMYPQGYVKQRIGSDGWQQNVYEHVEWASSPFKPVLDASGKRLVLHLGLGRSELHVAAWEVAVGRISLYLLDTHVDANTPEDREISSRLYGGDRTMRLRQEIVLGIGGVRLLRALKVPAGAFHANEGHSAFLFLELARELVEGGKTFAEAAAEVAGRGIFTTHTPVAAGHDVFDEDSVLQHFANFFPGLGVTAEQFLDLGRVPGRPGWNMTALALRCAGRANGVSRRHGDVSRKMWTPLWPGKGADEVPIGHVTNGVHLATWVQQDLGRVFDKHLGPDWQESQDDPALWSRAAAIPDAELWRVHQRGKRELFTFLRDRARERWMADPADAGRVPAQGALLDPAALTIGFARRFAGYKRASLVMRDLARLKKLLLDPWRPVQILFAGKAHPADDPGKELIQQVYRLARDPALGGRIAFVEDYDMHVARYLVHGCDLWLNNPQPPLEACGTSGMKASVNGLPNLSVADGWWEEGFNGSNGWSVAGSGAEGASDDAADAEAIYALLEEKVVPLFYERGPDGLPAGWIKVMRESIRSVAPRFSAARMVKDYVEGYYVPALSAPVAARR